MLKEHTTSLLIGLHDLIEINIYVNQTIDTASTLDLEVLCTA